MRLTFVEAENFLSPRAFRLDLFAFQGLRDLRA
jgi:hypothetical protein